MVMSDDLYCNYTEIDTDKDIRPCPFCGSEAYLNNYEQPKGCHRKIVMCGHIDCPMSIPPDGFLRATKKEALEIWNKRHSGF